MQPYFFPYLGYFQLVHAVDEFVFLDDVTFIKRGYINRNSLLLNGQVHRFTIPVQNISQFRPISGHYYLDSNNRFLDLLYHGYHRAPYFQVIFELVSNVLSCTDCSVAAVNAKSVMATCRYLHAERSFHFSSLLDPKSARKGDDRLIHLCAHREASTYINAAGGRALYDARRFEANGVSLGFIESRFPAYRQKANGFVPGLSIIDALMWNSPEQVVEMLRHYSVEYPASDPEQRT